jgi:hypothetical protein
MLFVRALVRDIELSQYLLAVSACRKHSPSQLPFCDIITVLQSKVFSRGIAHTINHVHISLLC